MHEGDGKNSPPLTCANSMESAIREYGSANEKEILLESGMNQIN